LTILQLLDVLRLGGIVLLLNGYGKTPVKVRIQSAMAGSTQSDKILWFGYATISPGNNVMNVKLKVNVVGRRSAADEATTSHHGSKLSFVQSSTVRAGVEPL